MTVRFRLVAVLLVLGLVAAVAALNWPVFTTPARLDLVFTSLELPFGLAMLGLVALTLLGCALYMATWRAADLVEARRNAEELRQVRRLADGAEAARFGGLQEQMRREFSALRSAMERESEQLRSEIGNHSNALAAQLAELDQRLGGAAPQRGASVPRLGP